MIRHAARHAIQICGSKHCSREQIDFCEDMMQALMMGVGAEH